MNEMPSREDHAAPTLRSAEVWLASRPGRRAPEIAVVEAARPASSGWPPPPSGVSLLSEVAREVATTLLDLALGHARHAWRS